MVPAALFHVHARDKGQGTRDKGQGIRDKDATSGQTEVHCNGGKRNSADLRKSLKKERKE